MYNKSKTYLLPLVSELIHLEKEFIDCIEDTYMYLGNDNTEYLCILQDFTFKNPKFTAYENRLTKNELFVKCIDLNDQVLYVFKFPKDYIQEFYFLLNSEYSKFGNDAKELILAFWAQMYKNNKEVIPVLIQVKQILYKDEKLKIRLEKDLGVKIKNNQELGEYLSLEAETFNINNFI